MTDYERYSVEFGYLNNAAAGGDVRVLRRGEHRIPSPLLGFDYWLINDRDLARMHYDNQGRFLGAESAPALAHPACREISACGDRAAEVERVWSK